MRYKYETHAHTKEASACASASGEEQAEFYKSKGYDGIFITDHFFNGNTCVPADLSWEERVDRFAKGYENAKKCGDEIGLKVFFGWEYSYRGADLLTYGLDKEWLKRNPAVMDMDVNAYCDFVHEEGGFIVHAHPFREDWYIDMLRLFPRKCDGCEVINSCRKELENEMAMIYAKQYGLIKTAGSDNHIADQYRLSGIASIAPIYDEEQFIDLLKSGNYNIFDDYST